MKIENNYSNGYLPYQEGAGGRNQTFYQEGNGVETSLSAFPGRITNSGATKTCCCKKSMIEALKLLCNTELADIIDFQKFAFLTDNFIVGAKLVLLKLGTSEKDNLSNLDGEFKRFSPCNCDLIEIGGQVSYDVPLPVSLTDLAEQLVQLIQNIIDILGEKGIVGSLIDILKEFLKIFDPAGLSEEILQSILDFILEYFTTIPYVDKASLCNLNVVAFQTRYVSNQEADDTTRDKATEANFQRAKEIFQCNLDTECNSNTCSCKCDCDDCCCNENVIRELLGSNCSRRVTLTAGNLTLREVMVLGRTGNVLVLANDKKRRFYFVCADSIQFFK